MVDTDDLIIFKSGGGGGGEHDEGPGEAPTGAGEEEEHPLPASGPLEIVDEERESQLRLSRLDSEDFTGTVQAADLEGEETLEQSIRENQRYHPVYGW
jgi:hypothetical protein